MEGCHGRLGHVYVAYTCDRSVEVGVTTGPANSMPTTPTSTFQNRQTLPGVAIERELAKRRPAIKLYHNNIGRCTMCNKS
jgi:hypothetical protein